MRVKSGVISQPSPYSVTETLARLEAILRSKGITIFARFDPKIEAEQAGLNLRPTQLLLFGNPKAGTPVMAAVPLIAIDLPLKVLAWQDEAGQVWLSYNAPNYLQQRFSLSDELAQNLSGIETLIKQALA